jgi:hypothetical protein
MAYVIQRGQIIQIDTQKNCRCTICGLWKPNASYEENGQRVRTNCEDCFMLPINEYNAMNERFGTHRVSGDWVWKNENHLRYTVNQMNDEKRNGITKAAILAQIQALVEQINELPEDTTFHCMDDSDDGPWYNEPHFCMAPGLAENSINIGC